MYIFANKTQSDAQTEAQNIIDIIVAEQIGQHTVVTSERRDMKKHKNFMNVANDLRKRGLKVEPIVKWNETQWLIRI